MRKEVKREMNQVSSEQNFQNPWASREKLPRVSTAHLFLAAVICFLCAVCIPLCANWLFALVTLAVLFAYVAAVGRNPLTVSLVLVTTVLFTVLGSVAGIGFAVGAVLLSSVVGCETATLLMTALRRPYLGLLMPIAAFGTAFYITGRFPTALAALSFLPAAILLAVATLRGKSRTSAICFAECGFLLSIVGVAAVLIWQIYGNVGPTAIRASIEAVREGVVRALLAVRDQNVAAFEGVYTGDAAKEWVERVNQL